MKFETKIRGLKELDDALSQFPAKLAKKAMAQAAREGANILFREIKARVPVDSGNLLKSLAIKAWNKKGRIVFLVGPRVTSRKKTGKRERREVKNDGWYAFLVEFGTVKNKPSPFMRPAFDESAQRAQDAVINRLRSNIDALVRESASRLQ